jgi:hypothetical protein
MTYAIVVALALVVLAPELEAGRRHQTSRGSFGSSGGSYGSSGGSSGGRVRYTNVRRSGGSSGGGYGSSAGY